MQFSSKNAYGLLLVPGDDTDDMEDTVSGDQMPLDYVEELFALDEEQMHHLMDLFERAATDGTIDRATFEMCFEEVLGVAPDEETAAQMHQILSKLFDIFDRDGNGIVDANEFNAGLSVLNKQDNDSSVRRALNSYDIDGTGDVSLDEMTRYLKSIFAVIAQNTPEVFAAHGVSADQLAVATAKSCFAEADLNHDGRLSFDEFKQWYESSDSDAIRQFESSANAQVCACAHFLLFHFT